MGGEQLSAPSGEQHEIRFGDQHAVIVEVGGGLREYGVGARAVLDGYALEEMASGGRGQVLLPWPNRIDDGSYTFERHKYQLPLSEPAYHNASHGLVRWENWTLESRGDDRLVMHYLLHPQPGYPNLLDVHLGYVLGAQGLTVTVTATNLGSMPCPYGHGFHPYLKLGGSGIDDLQLGVPAHRVLRANARRIPTWSMNLRSSRFDFRVEHAIGGTKLDHAYTDFDRDAEGRVWAYLSDPGSGSRVGLWADAAYTYLMVFSGDTLAKGARRALAVEPMTCPPNAFRTGEGVITLAPGESHTSRWGITPALR
jgi:aldose 1-epimerase